jgi:hypothetical protein
MRLERRPWRIGVNSNNPLPARAGALKSQRRTGKELKELKSSYKAIPADTTEEATATVLKHVAEALHRENVTGFLSITRTSDGEREGFTAVGFCNTATDDDDSDEEKEHKYAVDRCMLLAAMIRDTYKRYPVTVIKMMEFVMRKLKVEIKAEAETASLDDLETMTEQFTNSSPTQGRERVKIEVNKHIDKFDAGVFLGDTEKKFAMFAFGAMEDIGQLFCNGLLTMMERDPALVTKLLLQMGEHINE